MSKKSMLLFGLVLVVLVLKEYQLFSAKSSTRAPKPILAFENAYIDGYLKHFDDTLPLHLYWGFKEQKPKNIEQNSSKQASSSQSLVTKEEGKNILCINSSCYRLIGIHYASNVPYATLYNKKQKKKLKDYAKLDTLEDNISIEFIGSNSVVFSNKDKTKSWQFKLFDVNRTKYKPKDINETDY